MFHRVRTRLVRHSEAIGSCEERKVGSRTCDFARGGGLFPFCLLKIFFHWGEDWAKSRKNQEKSTISPLICKDLGTESLMHGLSSASVINSIVVGILLLSYYSVRFFEIPEGRRALGRVVQLECGQRSGGKAGNYRSFACPRLASPPHQAKTGLDGGPGHPPHQAKTGLDGGPGHPPHQAKTGLDGGPGRSATDGSG
jgi:hypothetical protein